MINTDHYFPRGKVQTPPLVFSLVALLLIFLFSVTHQQVSATQAVPGFVGSLDPLVVASHSESFRTLSSNASNRTLADGDPELPDLWYGIPVPLGLGLCRDNSTLAAGEEYRPEPPRFLTPPVHAPPLA